MRQRKADPLALKMLRAQAVQVVVPAGCAVFWIDQLLHGVTNLKTPRAALTE
jgi:hypothetical protein